MTLQLVSEDKNLLEDIAEDLLRERLIANAMISGAVIFKTISDENEIITDLQYTLKGISKSLLFRKINTWLLAKYEERIPLLYCEPIIMIDPDQTEKILNKLIAV